MKGQRSKRYSYRRYTNLFIFQVVINGPLLIEIEFMSVIWHLPWFSFYSHSTLRHFVALMGFQE